MHTIHTLVAAMLAGLIFVQQGASQATATTTVELSRTSLPAQATPIPTTLVRVPVQDKPKTYGLGTNNPPAPSMNQDAAPTADVDLPISVDGILCCY